MHHRCLSSLHRQKGFSIAAAIFLVVVMALLATAMVKILTTSHLGLSQEMTASKAYLAGRSGLQWGMYQAMYASATGTHTVTFNNGALNGTQASVILNSNTVESEIFYTIDAAGSYGVSTDPEYSQRSLRLRFKKP
ncbi:MAG: hypothetical protein OEY89_11550 [Gammaproteobacteria bacterium]|nr:hypothetical protein [Gammaproteobacteria bacterium]